MKKPSRRDIWDVVTLPLLAVLLIFGGLLIGWAFGQLFRAAF